METERLLINKIVPSDKRDYFFNISHDRRVLETFICKYADTLDGFDFEPYLCAKDMFAVRLKETGRLIGIILYFDVKAIPARSATVSDRVTGTKATPPKPYRAFSDTACMKKASEKSTLHIFPRISLRAALWKSAA